MSTVAGSSVAGYADGVGTVARFNAPSGIAVSSSGTVYVCDVNNNIIRSVSSSTGLILIH